MVVQQPKSLVVIVQGRDDERLHANLGNEYSDREDNASWLRTHGKALAIRRVDLQEAPYYAAWEAIEAIDKINQFSVFAHNHPVRDLLMHFFLEGFKEGVKYHASHVDNCSAILHE